MHVVELVNVEKTYQLGEIELNVLKRITVRIKKGEFVSIVGPSGSGKSTVLHLIGALDRPTKGKVLIDGKDISKLTDSELAVIRGRKIGFVFQTFNLIPRMSALENVMLPMWFAGKDNRRERAAHFLKLVGLEKRMDHTPNRLSGGERQRVAIARALANDPEVVVADEPTGNLDSKTGEEIVKLLKDIHKHGNTVILVTHDKKVASMAQRTINIKDGKIGEKQ